MPVRKPDRRYGGGGNGNNYRSAASSSGPRYTRTIEASALRSSEATSRNENIQATRLAHSIDERMGFARYDSGQKRIGWLCNMHSTAIEDPKVSGGRAAVDYYFLEDDGGSFKASLEYDPYFLIAVRRGKEAEVEEWIRRRYEGIVKNVIRIEKEDLSMPNHLVGYRRTLLELRFANVNDLLAARREILPIAEKNRANVNAMDTYAEVASANAGIDFYDDDQNNETRQYRVVDTSNYIVDIREYDVPYHVRVAIDKDIRIGKWYTVEAKHGVVTLTCLEERLQRADPVVLAFDIETTKLPLKFPDSATDQIMMISYMIDGAGFLITNREIVSEDIADFEYTPKPEYEGPFMIFNEPNEKAVIERFFLHIKECKPTVIATYNGDFFDWPFVEARASINGVDMYQEIGFRKNSEDIYRCDYCVHMDCFAWVNRDSYLPQGSRGLKAVTTAKLGYDPDELDPELMTPYASEKPQVLAEYSVSDAVATYYLYMKYVHPFIFSLCTIIPLNPDDTLRKGTGTLCEMLLMVQAYQKRIVLPNKHKEPRETFWEGHLLESETYVGGHVESIEAGVFRSDIPYNFAIDPTAIDELINDLDAALTFSVVVEEKKSMDDIVNYDEVKSQIVEKLLELKETPNRNEQPSIYHLDVASMYPNIMTTNRLQPDSMISESDCAACDFNRPGKTCDRRMPWSWRGEFLPAHKNEYNMIRRALESEKFPGKGPNSLARSFEDLAVDEQSRLVKKRLQDYSKKIYHKIHEAKTIEREAIICQRENPFYVDTVKDFRDRRYDFKGKQKVWKNKTDALKSAGALASEIEEAKKMIVLFDSLQLAHKVILNSFYGYVMRKGSRWYSMEMAGVTCLTGARIIQMARELVERIGRPLELDTDGIWCMLPATFPENVAFTLKSGKKLPISYPCTMLNHLVHARYTNHQYQTLVNPKTFEYKTHSDNTIFFEVDGPYRAMILPTSKEEDKNLKKRYAVFNHDGSLAELKGFELKRRGELKLIKIFQKQIFKFFLEGTTLAETYAAVAKEANRWLDVLDSKGRNLADPELVDLICENKNMTKTVEEYGAQKSTAITTAKRLAEFLGAQMIKDKGLNCKYIIASRPRNAPVTERAIPIAIFSSEERVKRHFLRKWMREDPGDMDLRTILDWEYYRERLGSVIQKLITIPAALQKLRNPVPRIPHPDWLQRRINTKDDKFKQKKMTDLFEKQPLAELHVNALDHRIPMDLEDFGGTQMPKSKAQALKMSTKRKSPEPAVRETQDPYATLPKIMPNPSQDYSAFLSYQKQKWAIQKQARKRRRQLFGEKSTVVSDLGGFFRNQAVMVYTNTWQILQLRESDTPGLVQAFVLIDQKVHSLKVKVPRQVYLNLKGKDLPDVAIDDCEVEKVNHTLPNGHASVHLFRMSMSEEAFLNNADKVTYMFNHPSVEGVYEKQISLTIRAMLQLGSTCTFDETQEGVLGRGLEHGFDLSTLRRTASNKPYLSTASMGFYFLYHSLTSQREIFALFSTCSNQAYIIVMSRKKDSQGLTGAEKMYTELRARKLEEQGEDFQTNFEYQEKINFKTSNVTTRRKAYTELGDAIKRMHRDESRPMVFVMQSLHQRTLMHEIPVLKELPILTLQADPHDNQLPPLGWQPVALRRLINTYLAFRSWITHLIELARYGDIPLCNLEGDDNRFLIDVAYARRLQRNNVVLWWSPGSRPDHAGYEKDDIVGPMDKVQMPSINMPGTYSSVCVELEIRNLAVNTILTSALLNELEGSENHAMSVNSGQDGDGVLYSQSAFSAAGIATLREMVKAWWTEACKGSPMADNMVQHLIRWVESPSSYLYDKSLHRYVQMMSRKAFQQLMTDFKRVGSHVIFASPNRLLLQTTKAEVGNAYAYSQYILKSIQGKPLFNFLDLEIKEYWDYLVWYDEYNYGGKGCKEVVECATQTLETIMHWQLAAFLPPLYQPTFNDWVVEFIDVMHKLKRPQIENASDAPRLTQLPIRELTNVSDGAIDLSEIPEHALQALKSEIGKPLKKQLVSLSSRYRTELANPILAPDHEFPVLPGSHLDLSSTNPVLQLTKSIMHVYSLDKSLNLAVRALRKDLLSLFDVKEFSAEGRFENPSRQLSVEWSCAECTVIRDLELCRDEDLSPNSGEDETALVPWKCLHCAAPLPRNSIEEHLIAQVQAMVTAWSAQDLKCTKCGSMRVEACDFMEHCPCSGVWVASMDRTSMKGRLQVLNSVAKTHGMKMLGQVMQEIMPAV
ncbi:MAG: DNA polymerase epsilon catalytic subunit [Gomphillus americanus]|uniref:DNA polymerase epsilon catalytic subunit n=1 Tax=Gomphillus americanus TaxID=1940652 RepID=A0A8H3IJR4_9LECA|nr:MAG: DNA polymerase epsilon catalytic subunit [Gomphillus americanus]